MEMIGKIRRMHIRDRMSLNEIAKRTGLSRNPLYLSTDARSLNSVPPLVNIQPAQVVNIQPAATDKAEPFGQEWLMEPLLGHNPGQRSFQFGAGLLHIKPLHRVHRLVFGRFGVEFFGILHPRFAVQHDEAVGHFNARNRRLRI